MWPLCYKYVNAGKCNNAECSNKVKHINWYKIPVAISKCTSYPWLYYMLILPGNYENNNLKTWLNTNCLLKPCAYFNERSWS